jgi:hypothetical protein
MSANFPNYVSRQICGFAILPILCQTEFYFFAALSVNGFNLNQQKAKIRAEYPSTRSGHIIGGRYTEGRLTGRQG